MKKIIRLTESDLHNLIERSVKKILRENDNTLLLQSIAQGLVQQAQLTIRPGENEAEIELEGGIFVYVKYNVICNPYLQQGVESFDYEVPSKPSEIIDKPQVEVLEIEYCQGENCTQLQDNGIVKKALENNIDVDYSDFDVPYEDEFFHEEQ